MNDLDYKPTGLQIILIRAGSSLTNGFELAFFVVFLVVSLHFFCFSYTFPNQTVI